MTCLACGLFCVSYTLDLLRMLDRFKYDNDTSNVKFYVDFMAFIK